MEKGNSETSKKSEEKGVYCRDHPYCCRDHPPHTLTVPDGWACCRPVFVWKIFEISMIRVRASPPQSGQVAVSPSRRQSKSPRSL